MIVGKAQRRLSSLAWEIAIYDDAGNVAYTLELKEHLVKERSHDLPTTSIEFKHENVLRGLAQALAEMGILASDATTAELKATKYHLEDFRTLVFMKPKSTEGG